MHRETGRSELYMKCVENSLADNSNSSSPTFLNEETAVHGRSQCVQRDRERHVANRAQIEH